MAGYPTEEGLEILATAPPALISTALPHVRHVLDDLVVEHRRHRLAQHEWGSHLIAMLHVEPKRNYIVYPSWATLSYRWENLHDIFDDLFGSGFLTPGRDADYFIECGYPLDPQPYKLYDGAGGGGIILWEGDVLAGRGWRWLPIVVLGSEARISTPPGMPNSMTNTLGTLVFIIEPHGGGGLSRPKLHQCMSTVENVEAAGDSIYWVACSTTGDERIQGVETLLDSARGFGIDLAPNPDVPQAVRNELDRWIPDPRLHRSWFKIQAGGGTELGFHFAALVYSAYRLKALARKKFVSMHLVSQIEGKPNVLRLWNWEAIGHTY